VPTVHQRLAARSTPTAPQLRHRNGRAHHARCNGQLSAAAPRAADDENIFEPWPLYRCVLIPGADALAGAHPLYWVAVPRGLHPLRPSIHPLRRHPNTA
jgi:hypothetical protein